MSKSNGPAVPPNITTPLITATNQTPQTGTDNLGLLNSFIGTWNSPTGNDATGYNVMPLPQVGATDGYITKNFPYFEEITFAPIAGGAPNREGNFTQQSGVLFYEQRVYFATNVDPSGNQPIENTLIHAENGSWLFHKITEQLEGPFGPGNVTPPNPLPTQPPNIQYNKQVSVPHGNSILMVGGPVANGTGNPSFSEQQSLYLNLPPFSDGRTGMDPAKALSDQLAALNKSGVTVESYASITVSSAEVEGGGVSNILFENKYGRVTRMDTTWYVENLSNGKTQLQYIQIIWLEFNIGGGLKAFAHVDANTLQLV